MPSVGNELNHVIDGLTVRGGLGLEGVAGQVSYLNRDVASMLARQSACMRDLGYYAETGQRVAASASSVTVTQRLYGVSIGLLAGDLVSNLIAACNTANNTPTLTKLGLYSQAGVLLASSADASSAFGSTGLKVTAMTTPYLVPADDMYYAAFLNVATTGAALNRLNGGSSAFQASTGGAAPQVNQDTQSDLPASATFTATANAFGLWIAVS